jgi:hypothetical protein
MRIMGIKRGEISQAAGTIGVISQPLSRYTDFTIALISLMRPASAKWVWRQGMDVTSNYNGLVNDMAGDWLWIMGDDHTFPPDILLNLIAHDVDVVVPLCLKKMAPFDPVVYEGEEVNKEDGLTYHQVARLPRDELVEIHAAGTAGMLIRRHVFEALSRPVFETSHGMQNEDLLFCKKVREAGFKIYCDTSQKMGHIGTFGVYPVWQGDRFGPMLDLGNGEFTPIFAFTAEEQEAMLRELEEAEA